MVLQYLEVPGVMTKNLTRHFGVGTLRESQRRCNVRADRIQDAIFVIRSPRFPVRKEIINRRSTRMNNRSLTP